MPKRIGKYEITAEIGRGGFSRVYRGFDPNVNRPVAIKVSTRESDPEHLSRFRNEASAAGNLRHENIVTIHDYGDDDGVPYLVMELLDGRDLHHIMRDGPKLSLLEKMQVMSQVAEGLHCAHMNGIVHRDIKPANLMVLPDGAVKILDFGIARMTGEVSRVTQSGYLVGTPLYMSPEQLSGSDADALGDVWAYGVLYFELLTGQHPFLSQDNTRLIRNISIVNPPSVHSITRGVPEGLSQVIRRALTKDRRRRYQSLEEVLVDTNPILALLQREQTAGLVTEAQLYKNSGQLMAARQTSRRALEIDPSNFGAQQLLKSIQHEIHEEKLAEPVAVVPAPPAPTPVRAVPPPPLEIDEPEMIFPDPEPEETPLPVAPPKPRTVPSVAPQVAALVQPLTPRVVPPPPPPLTPVIVAPPPMPMLPVQAPAAAALASAVETPPTSPKTRPSLAAGGAAAAIAAAVAAAKARQAEEEKLQKEREKQDEPAAPAIKASPLVVSALPVSRVAPPAPATASVKRQENGSGLFVTGEPLVVKRPATAVMTQRMKAADTSAAVATPVPAPPPTRLPGVKAIPATVTNRAANGTGPAEAKPPSAAPSTTTAKPAAANGRAASDNLPMRRPPSEVYAKGGRRRNSNSLFLEKEKPGKPFPWAVVLFVSACLVAGAAVLLFALSAPKYVRTPTLVQDKINFAWKAETAAPPAKALTLKGGPANSSYTASSTEDWLVVTADNDEPTNRSWQVKVEPEKLGTTLPNNYTGWIDVASSEGFKTQAEVTLKIGASEAPAKSKKAAASAPTTTSVPAAADKKPAPAAVIAPAPVATAKKPAAPAEKASDKNKPAVPDAKPASANNAASKTVTEKQPAPKQAAPPKPAPQKPANDGIEIN